MRLHDIPEADEVTTDWWAATREHRLVMQSCIGCGHVQHPPRAVCTACSSMDELTMSSTEGEGIVDSWTVVHRGPRPDVEVPYTIARVRLTEGPILLTRLEGPDSWTIGDRVTVGWIDLDDGRALPVFHRAAG